MSLTEFPFNLLGQARCPLEFCLTVLEGDYSTVDKKEAMSSIGRKRRVEYKPILFQYARHSNPEVAMQAIRGLLVFKKDDDVVSLLNELINHPNDMVRDIAQN